MSSFQDTMILECNRLASEEGKTSSNDNPALFTNKIGSGIKVNAGDNISIQSAFISELGAGSDTIQFNGKVLTDNLGNPLTINLSNTTISKTNACYQNPIYSNSDNQVKIGEPLLELASIEEKTYILKDNEINLKISYYKTRNGDCCVALPRRYMSEIPLLEDTRPALWTIEDDFNSGMPHKGISLQNGGVLCLKSVVPALTSLEINRSYFVEDDYIFKKGSKLITDSPHNACNSYYKLKSDNSRYKIFVNADVEGVRKAGLVENSEENMRWYPFQSPSESHYIPYEEILTLTAPIGFSSPQSIADSLTNQLRETGALENNYYHEWNTSATSDQIRLKTPISVKTESKTYKTFNSFSVNNHNASTYYHFYNASTPLPIRNETWMYNQYLQNYQFIGLKRPDFYIKGMELQETLPETHNNASYNRYTRLEKDINACATSISASYNGRYNASIVIEHEWTKTNLDAWKGWLDTQGNYPELFTNENNNYAGLTTKDNSRFLHMNLNMDNASLTHVRLGGDNMTTSSWNASFLAEQNASSQNSVPLFFDFDPSASNTYTNGENEDACYGFAHKHLSPNGSYVISFGTSKIGTGVGEQYNNLSQTTAGIPLEYAYYSGSHTSSGYVNGLIVGNYKVDYITPNNVSGRCVGFDKHFNAFGNCMIGLQDGYLTTNYNFDTHYAVNTQENNATTLGGAIIDATPFAEKIYLGSQEPKFEYSGSNQKFNISQLHTPEYIGNLWNAGIDSTQAENNTTSNPSAQEKVFHINKRINNTNWTPDMIPYSQNYASGLESIYPNPDGTNGSYTLSTMNQMISPWKIFDAQSGIFIEHFGVSQNAWNKSMWDTLGFTYSQFHASFNASFNYNTRVNEINKKHMPILTTNADVNAGDTINFISNIWGSVLLTPQVPLPMLFNSDTGTDHTPPFVANRYPQSYPAITESQNSILLEADNLPTKMSKAYYTIRSSLLDKYTFLGSKDSGTPQRIIGIVNKINGDGDYYFQQDNELNFTITNPKTITEITTSIHDPDGSFAKLNRDSCVIYKINKTINSTLTPVDELLQNTNK